VLLSGGDAPLTTIEGFLDRDSFLEMEKALPAVCIEGISIPIIQGATLPQEGERTKRNGKGDRSP
jgi:hypothetical protein